MREPKNWSLNFWHPGTDCIPGYSTQCPGQTGSPPAEQGKKLRRDKKTKHWPHLIGTTIEALARGHITTHRCHDANPTDEGGPSSHANQFPKDQQEFKGR